VIEEREPASIAAGIPYAMFGGDVAEMYFMSECECDDDELL
jgi:hypothetical protein